MWTDRQPDLAQFEQVDSACSAAYADLTQKCCKVQRLHSLALTGQGQQQQKLPFRQLMMSGCVVKRGYDST